MKGLYAILLLASVALIPARPFAAPQAAAAMAGRLIEVTTTDAGGKYLFEPSTIAAKPGEQIHLRLKSVSSNPGMAKMPKAAMAHNFVLIKAGVEPTQFAMSGMATGLAGEYLPADKSNVIAFTALAAMGETVDVSFKAPAAGTYPYICSFPGHLALGMKGSLVVK